MPAKNRILNHLGAYWLLFVTLVTPTCIIISRTVEKVYRVACAWFWWLLGLPSRAWSLRRTKPTTSSSSSSSSSRSRTSSTSSTSRRLSLDDTTTHTLTTRDGVELQYYTLGNGPRVLVFCNGLGCRLFKPIAPLIHDYGRAGWTFVTWDYRGLFRAKRPKRIRRLAIHEHAEDLVEILRAQEMESVSVLIGWSMGVQVTLETVSLYPEMIQSLVLLNGTHGQVFQTAFQPLFRVPYVNLAMQSLVDFLKDNPRVLRSAVNFIWRRKFLVSMWVKLYTALFNNKHEKLRERLGKQYFEAFMFEYLGDLLGSAQHMHGYLSLFQELDAHSVLHLLRTIEHPTLIIAGALDLLTPAYQSYEMASRMPNSKLRIYATSSHASLLEKSGQVVLDITEFLNEHVDKFRRRGSSRFDPVRGSDEALLDQEFERMVKELEHSSSSSSSDSTGEDEVDAFKLDDCDVDAPPAGVHALGEASSDEQPDLSNRLQLRRRRQHARATDVSWSW